MPEPIVEVPPVPIPPRRRAPVILLALALLAAALWMAASFVPALLWAGVMAIAVEPLYERLGAAWPRRAKGMLLPLLVTLAIALLVILPIAFGVWQAAHEAGDVMIWLQTARHDGLPVPGWLRELPFGRDAATRWWQANLATAEAAQRQLHRLDTQALISHSKLLGSSLLHRAVTFAFTLVALFFLLRDGDAVADQARVAGDRIFGPAGLRIGRQIILSVRGTIDGLVLVGIGEGAVMTPFYLLAGVPHPILFGAVTALAAMIPFGAAVIFAAAALLLLVQGQVIWAIAIVVVGLAVVGVADHFVRPVLIGGATKLPFLWVLIGILGGVESFGLLGLFIGPAIMAVLMLLWRELVQHGRPAELSPAP